MNGDVIYYPYIEVPQNEWFTRVLLYWDKINSIIPSDCNLELSDYMYSLLDYELIKPIHPYECTSIANFKGAFLNHIDNREYPIPRGAIKKLSTSTLKLHIQKMDLIGDELVKRGLARKSEYDGWYDVESYTANQFMAYMAGTLGAKSGCTPITDTVQHLSSFEPKSILGGTGHLDLDEMRTKILNILPAPSEGIDAEKLSNFKEDHRSELLNFRKEIELTIKKASLISDYTQKEEYIGGFVLDCSSKVEDISQALKSSGWNHISYGSICLFVGASINLSYAISNNSIIPAIAAACGTYAAGSRIYDELRLSAIKKNNFVTYAVLAQQQF